MFIVRHLICTFYLAHAFLQAVVSETLQSTRHALYELYESTGGANWNYTTMADCGDATGEAWNFTTNAKGEYMVDPCSNESQFIGLNCTDDKSTVTGIALACGNLTGTIPELSTLTLLYQLDLEENQLTGTIPEFSTLTQLQYLLLYQNQLTGTIPEFRNLTQLRKLGLSQNSISGTIPEFKALTQLQYLDLYRNHLSGTIPEFSTLNQLLHLGLSQTHLSGTIPEFSALKHLRHLDVFQNHLSGTIPAFRTSEKLTRLLLAQNQLTGTIPEFSTLAHLYELHLHQNLLTGTIPKFSTSTQLYQLMLFQNQLTGTIPEFSTLTNLQYLLLYQNQLTGTIPEQLSALSNLSYIALGSNCIHGTLPESLCHLKKLRLLELTSVGGDKSCREDTFKGRFLGHYFDGFTTSKYLKGTIPDCIWNLPNLATLYAGGNRIRGHIPEVLGSQLQNISLSFNYLNGTLPSALVTNPNISNIAVQNNRLQGDLSVFSGISHLKDFNASVNSLSGIIPKSLLGLLHIDILTGNVFDCSLIDRNLPLKDPSKGEYQCGSNLYNQSFYTFIIVLMICFAVILYCSVLSSQYFRELQLWREVAMGKKWRTVNIGISLTAVHKYAYHLFDLQWSMLKMSVALLVALISYLSLWKSRSIEYSYGWISTAAYITGSNTAIALVCVYFIIIFSITLICYKYEEKDQYLMKNGNDEESNVEKKEEHPLRELAAFASRMICLTSFIWGFLIAGNALYLYVLLNFSIATQNLFRYFFAIFKWIWVRVITYRLFEMDALTFGLPRDKHLQLIDKYCGSQLRFIFLMNAVSLFFIPVITQMVVDPACFYHYFISASMHTFTSESSLRCSDPFWTTVADCRAHRWYELTTDIMYDINADVPFLYNYTCSPAIIRAYIPLYANMYCLIIAKCLIQYVYLFYTVKQEIDERADGVANNDSRPSEAAGLLKYLYMTFPLNQLMWDSHQRKERSKGDNAFPTSSKLWIWKRMPNNLGTILVFVTFGTLAPLLGLVIIIALIGEVYITELVIGRFLVREISVIIYSKRNERTIDGFKYERVPLSTDPSIQKQAEAVHEHWGAIAAVKEVTKLCEEVPLSIFSSSRVVILLLMASVLSFLLNDVANSSGNPYESVLWPSFVMIASPFVSIFVLRLYKWKSEDAAKRMSGMELERQYAMELMKMEPEETNSPIHP